MSLSTIAIFTLVAAFCNGAIVALIANLHAESRRAQADAAYQRAAHASLPRYAFDTVVNPPQRHAAPVRPDTPDLCWGDTGVSSELQAAALLHKLGQSRHERVISDRLVA